MEVELHTLFRIAVSPFCAAYLMFQDTVDKAHFHLLVKGVKGNRTLYEKVCSGLDK